MLGFWSKVSRDNKKAKEAISTARSILGRNASNIEPKTAELVKEKISRTERALASGNHADVLSRTEELEETVSERLSQFTKSKLRQNTEALLIAVALALFIRTFIVQPFKIPSGSMIPTLLVGDHLLVNKFVYGTELPFLDTLILPGIKDIERGDVVVFIYPNDEHDPSKSGIYYIKRVVGLPGDSIEIKGRSLYINGEEMPLEYEGSYVDDRTGFQYDRYTEDIFGRKHTVIYEAGRENTQKGEYIPVAKVPKGHVFVMGDNRDNSQDSRFWGFVPIENIEGKAFIIHWSWDLGNENILNKVRWNRIISLME